MPHPVPRYSGHITFVNSVDAAYSLIQREQTMRQQQAKAIGD